MDRTADIIPIASRRAHPPAGAAAAASVRSPWGSVPHTPVRSPWGVVALVGAGLVFVAAVASWGGSLQGNARDLPAPARGALYRRSLEDVKSACTLPAARAGALRDHCVGQAQFLLSFPECDAQCRRTSAAILPHAHR